MEPWEKALQYGWPTLALLAVGYGVWKGLWPTFKVQLESALKLLTQQLEYAQKNVEETRLENQRTTAHFLMSLEKRDKVMEEGFDRLSHILQELERKLEDGIPRRKR